MQMIVKLLREVKEVYIFQHFRDLEVVLEVAEGRESGRTER